MKPRRVGCAHLDPRLHPAGQVAQLARMVEKLKGLLKTAASGDAIHAARIFVMNDASGS